ncbi:MAG: hypothetical protein GX624_04960 [Actinobacteria bacterium]|nr:hypothetical protein [Actinomycetota bacterium]
MRRLLVAATLCAALLLPAAAAYAAPPAHPGDGHHTAGGPAASPAGLPDVRPAAPRFVPLARQFNPGAATISGTLRDFWNVPVAGRDIEWWGEDDDGRWYWNGTVTGAAGSYSMTAMPTTNGEVYAYPSDDSVLGFQAQEWADGGTRQLDFSPGRILVRADLGGDWADAFQYLQVRVWGTDRYSYGEVPADGTLHPEAVVNANSGTYYWGSAKFFADEGVEFESTITVPAFAQAGGSVQVDQASAQRIWSTSPRWASCKPGTSVRIVRTNFPAGWVNQVTGYTDDPKGSGSKVFGNRMSSGAAQQALTVKIPATAKPGYTYWIGFQHVNGIGTLYLETPIQLCTMKPSRTKIKKGAKIRVTGVVPTEGHWGSKAGKRKRVTLWWHKGTAKVPTKWDPRKQGWIGVTSVKCNGLGAYKTPYFKPPRTGTFVLQYSGDNWYWGAFSSTKKVTVR